MTTDYYTLIFSREDPTNISGFILALENRKGIVSPARLSAAYYHISQQARKFAAENGLSLSMQRPPDASPDSVRDLSDYVFADASPNDRRFQRHLGWLHNNKKIPVFPIRIRTYGGPEELVGRQEKIKEISAALEQKHVSLRAPRTLGKTALLHFLKQRPPSGRKPAFVVCRGVSSPEAFVGRLVYALKEGEADPRDMQKAAEKAENEAKGSNWKEAMSRVLSGEGEFLLLVDEFTDFLRGLDETGTLEEFLEDFIDILGLPSVCFVFASSESEDRMFGKHAEDLNKLIEKIAVPPLSRHDAELLLEELVYCAGLTPRNGDMEAACDLIGEFVPYFVHAFAAAWQEAGRRSSSPEDITPESVYYNELLGLTGWNLLRDVVDMPKKYAEPRPKGARRILNRLADCESEQESQLREHYGSIGTDEGFEDTIERLTDDMLIARVGDRDNYSFRFYSNLLKDFWKRYPTR